MMGDGDHLRQIHTCGCAFDGVNAAECAFEEMSLSGFYQKRVSKQRQLLKEALEKLFKMNLELLCLLIHANPSSGADKHPLCLDEIIPQVQC